MNNTTFNFKTDVYTENPVMLGDSYKYGHPFIYPEGMTAMSSYLEARKGVWPATVMFGLQYVLMKYFSKPITKEHVEEAAEFAELHGVPFDYDGWMYIVNMLGGKLPLEIKAAKEGSVIPNREVMVIITSTDSRVPWVVGFLETVLLHVWYGSTIATKSFFVKKMLTEFAEKSCSSNDVTFQFHNFGFRGSSSVESADIGGVAHLTQFYGTDNFHSLRLARYFYGAKIAGYSIVATEHSTVTVNGRQGEYKFLVRYVEKFKDNAIIACVMDSYNLFKAVDFITSDEAKEKIESDGYPIFVIRPDSGDPIEIIPQILDIMMSNGIAHTVNDKGYIEFAKYRIIWGDGINPDTIRAILKLVTDLGYASSNFAFGSGGDLMQNVNRDTQGMAVKCSWAIVDGEEIEVYKDPITDPGKTSKKGQLMLYKKNNTFFTEKPGLDIEEALDVVYKDGEIIRIMTLDEIRECSSAA